ncbi:MAG: nitrous oxide reductase family maturation protein NosD [Crocinitomicaceae bacterium]
MLRFLLAFICFFPLISFGKTLKVGKNEKYKTIVQAINNAVNGDTVLVFSGIYKEGNINVTKSIALIGKDFPVIDGEHKYENISFKANKIVLKGFKIINSGEDEVKNVGAVRLYDSHYSIIEDNIFDNNYFGITIQRGYKCVVRNNKIVYRFKRSQEKIGDGIHIWNSSHLKILNNYIEGTKDGIYLEKATHVIVDGNYSTRNLRYGLHFMFSNDNSYSNNTFNNNYAGVAVMYSMHVDMYKNKFINNWGDGAYGVLLKEISFSKIEGNIFDNNTAAVYMDGATKIDFFKNKFANNGWGVKINANCMENKFAYNHFENNTFDMSTNGSLVMNTFNKNYWDKYQGYDLNKNKIGDIPYHPLSLYSVLSDKNPTIMLLYRSFIVDLLDRIEKMIPSFTPDNFIDKFPLMKSPIKD